MFLQKSVKWGGSIWTHFFFSSFHFEVGVLESSFRFFIAILAIRSFCARLNFFVFFLYSIFTKTKKSQLQAPQANSLNSEVFYHYISQSNSESAETCQKNNIDWIEEACSVNLTFPEQTLQCFSKLDISWTNNSMQLVHKDKIRIRPHKSIRQSNLANFVYIINT